MGEKEKRVSGMPVLTATDSYWITWFSFSESGMELGGRDGTGGTLSICKGVEVGNTPDARVWAAAALSS